MDRGRLYKSIAGLLVASFLLAFSLSPVADCPEEISRIPDTPAAWGYYHHNMLEHICAVTITDAGGEHVYYYDTGGDADYTLTWLGPNIIWIDNLGGQPVEGVSYWVGYNGQGNRLWLPWVGR